MRKKIVSAVIAIVAIGICNAHSLFFYFLPLKVERNEALNKLDVPSHPSCQKCDGENFLYFDINVQ